MTAAILGGASEGATLISTTTIITPTVSGTYTVPAGCQWLWVKMWGAGGGGAGAQASGEVADKAGTGGAGGFCRALIPVTPAETLDYTLGEGGTCSVTIGSRKGAPGGGQCFGGGTIGAGDGGGYTSLFRSTTPLLVAGAGGGGGYDISTPSSNNYGGNGGGTVGNNGTFDTSGGSASDSGKGGTQSAGGAATATGFAGAAYAGGGATWNNGGAGGAGYYGGSGGSNHAGGGGGSSYISATNNLNTYTEAQSQKKKTPPLTSDTHYQSGHGEGGNGLVFAIGETGGDGLIVILAYDRKPSVLP